MSDPLEQYALDWHRLTDAWVERLEVEMDEAFRVDDARRYRFAAFLRGEIVTARQVMLTSVKMGSGSKLGSDMGSIPTPSGSAKAP